MAFEPAAVDGLQEAVAQIYADAEVQLLARIASSIERGIDTPQWVSMQLAEIARLSKEARGFLLSLDPVVSAQIQTALAQAHAAGVAAADQDVPGPPATSPAPIVSQEAVAALAAEAAAAVVGTHSQILRATVDGYREVVTQSAGRIVTGVATRREVTQQALDQFAARGLTAFRDRAGRNWRIDTYAEMAVRTAALRALKQGHTDRLLQRGYDLVVISAHPNPAPQCQPYEGKIVSLTGQTPNGPIEATSRMTGRPVRETVVASISEAEAKGLHHPNCKHGHTAWIPGAPRPAVAPHNPQGYKDEQKLRRLERSVREAKRQQAAAITPAAKTKAGQKLRARQAAIRDHVAQTGVTRRRHREQLRTGNAGNATEPTTLVRNAPPVTDADLARMSDDELGTLAVKAVEAQDFGLLDRIDAEDARRKSPSVPDPAPAPAAARPKREFKALSDEELGDLAVKAIESEDFDLLDRIEAEDMHRRKLAEQRAARWAGYEREYDRLTAEGMDHEEAVEKAYGISVKTQRSQAAISFLRTQGFEGASFNELARAAFRDQAYRHWLDAENATNGYMLSAAGERAGVDPRSLWFGSEKLAEKYASEELRAYWDERGRTTLEEFKAELLDPQSAARMRSARGDFLR
ncbi:phage minor capsid protein [Nocardia testacea]|uniref:phage minor capsid protein n=1 Tax=Nocardia testacea TaxID=248551 RepID=UPI0002E2D362|nr:phage minor capsid protein [Nocardia testacea]